MKTHTLSHVAVSVPPGTLTDEYRNEVLAFYGGLLGWREIDALRLPDRLTILVGHGCYLNLRERSDAMTSTGYEHFGVLVRSPEDLEQVWEELHTKYPDVNVEPESMTEGGHRTVPVLPPAPARSRDPVLPRRRPTLKVFARADDTYCRRSSQKPFQPTRVAPRARVQAAPLLGGRGARCRARARRPTARSPRPAPASGRRRFGADRSRPG